MIRIVSPTCDSCHNNAAFESALGVQFCYQCLYLTAGFFNKHGLIESNLLCEALFDGVWRITDSTYEIWFPSATHDNSSGVRWVQRVVN